MRKGKSKVAHEPQAAHTGMKQLGVLLLLLDGTLVHLRFIASVIYTGVKRQCGV